MKWVIAQYINRLSWRFCPCSACCGSSCLQVSFQIQDRLPSVFSWRTLPLSSVTPLPWLPRPPDLCSQFCLASPEWELERKLASLLLSLLSQLVSFLRLICLLDDFRFVRVSVYRALWSLAVFARRDPCLDQGSSSSSHHPLLLGAHACHVGVFFHQALRMILISTVFCYACPSYHVCDLTFYVYGDVYLLRHWTVLRMNYDAFCGGACLQRKSFDVFCDASCCSCASLTLTSYPSYVFCLSSSISYIHPSTSVFLSKSASMPLDCHKRAAFAQVPSAWSRRVGLLSFWGRLRSHL